MQNYNTLAETQKLSIHLGGGFWRHVTFEKNIGTDQRGDRWFIKGQKVYSEFLPFIVSLQNCVR